MPINNKYLISPKILLAEFENRKILYKNKIALVSCEKLLVNKKKSFSKLKKKIKNCPTPCKKNLINYFHFKSNKKLKAESLFFYVTIPDFHLDYDMAIIQ